MDQLRNEEWTCLTSEMVAFCNYRMLLNEIGCHLNEFKSSKEFVGAVADTIEGKVLIIPSLLCWYSSILLQCMMLLSLMPKFFIMISVLETSLSVLKAEVS